MKYTPLIIVFGVAGLILLHNWLTRRRDKALLAKLEKMWKTNPKIVPPSSPSDSMEMFRNLTEHANIELSNAHTFYARVATALGIIGALVVWYVGASHNDFRDSTRDQLTKELATFRTTLDIELTNQIAYIKAQTQLKVAEAFLEENITNMVRREAERRIQAIADSLIRTHVSNQLAAVEFQIATNNAIQKSLLEHSEFVMKVLRAQNDNLQEFKSLEKMAFSKRVYSGEAQFVVAQIQNQFLNTNDLLVATPFSGKATWTAAEVETYFKRAGPAAALPFVHFVHGLTNISRPAKARLMYMMFTNGQNSIRASRQASLYLADYLRLPRHPGFDTEAVERRYAYSLDGAYSIDP